MWYPIDLTTAVHFNLFFLAAQHPHADHTNTTSIGPQNLEQDCGARGDGSDRPFVWKVMGKIIEKVRELCKHGELIFSFEFFVSVLV